MSTGEMASGTVLSTFRESQAADHASYGRQIELDEGSCSPSVV